MNYVQKWCLSKPVEVEVVAGSVLLPLGSLVWKVETESESLKLFGVSKNVLAGTFISISACVRVLEAVGMSV
jgi:hypothetical protein